MTAVKHRVDVTSQARDGFRISKTQIRIYNSIKAFDLDLLLVLVMMSCLRVSSSSGQSTGTTIARGPLSDWITDTWKNRQGNGITLSSHPICM